MILRRDKSIVNFRNSFFVPGLLEKIPGGRYEVTREVQLLIGLSFREHRRAATYLAVPRKDDGGFDMRQISERDLEFALSRDQECGDDRSAF